MFTEIFGRICLIVIRDTFSQYMIRDQVRDSGDIKDRKGTQSFVVASNRRVGFKVLGMGYFLFYHLVTINLHHAWL